MSTIDDRLVPVFIGQHWLVSLDDVLHAAGSRDQISSRLRSGRWTQADHHVYRLAGAPVTWHSRLLAPILSAQPTTRVVASHLSAAALHGIPGYGRSTPELSTPRGYNLRRPGLRIRTSNDLDRCDTVVLEGVPTTDLRRTLLDIGKVVGDQRLLRGIEWARRERDVTWSGLISTLAHHARRGRGGIRRLRRVIVANAHRDEVTDSDFELLLLSLLLEHDLPEPVLHHRVYDNGRFVAEVDLAYPERRVAIEADGGIHLRPEVRERDLARQNDLLLCGWTVLRFTWDRFVQRPEQVVAEIRDALRPAELPPSSATRVAATG